MPRRPPGAVAQPSCAYCARDISRLTRVLCAECPGGATMTCVDCFSVGAALLPHSPGHAYTVLEEVSVPAFQEGWAAAEEVRLLDAICRYGPANWRAVADAVGGGKGVRACEAHYERVYLGGKDGSGLDGLIPGPDVLEEEAVLERREELGRRREAERAHAQDELGRLHEEERRCGGGKLVGDRIERNSRSPAGRSGAAAVGLRFVGGDSGGEETDDEADEDFVPAGLGEADGEDDEYYDCDGVETEDGDGAEAREREEAEATERRRRKKGSADRAAGSSRRRRSAGKLDVRRRRRRRVVEEGDGDEGEEDVDEGEGGRNGGAPGDELAVDEVVEAEGAVVAESQDVDGAREESGGEESDATGAMLPGFLEKRGDFDVEHDDAAEEVLADIVITPEDTDEERELKLRLLEIYNERLTERERAKSIVLSSNMLDFAAVTAERRAVPAGELELVDWLARFQRVLPREEFARFREAVLVEHRLAVHVERLKRYRALGCRTFADARRYDIDATARMSALGFLADESPPPPPAWKPPLPLGMEQQFGRPAGVVPEDDDDGDCGGDGDGCDGGEGVMVLPPSMQTVYPALPLVRQAVDSAGTCGLSTAEREICSAMRLRPDEFVQLRSSILERTDELGYGAGGSGSGDTVTLVRVGSAESTPPVAEASGAPPPEGRLRFDVRAEHVSRAAAAACGFDVRNHASLPMPCFKVEPDVSAPDGAAETPLDSRAPEAAPEEHVPTPVVSEPPATAGEGAPKALKQEVAALAPPVGRTPDPAEAKPAGRRRHAAPAHELPACAPTAAAPSATGQAVARATERASRSAARMESKPVVPGVHGARFAPEAKRKRLREAAVAHERSGKCPRPNLTHSATAVVSAACSAGLGGAEAPSPAAPTPVPPRKTRATAAATAAAASTIPPAPGAGPAPAAALVAAAEPAAVQSPPSISARSLRSNDNVTRSGRVRQ